MACTCVAVSCTSVPVTVSQSQQSRILCVFWSHYTQVSQRVHAVRPAFPRSVVALLRFSCPGERTYAHRGRTHNAHALSLGLSVVVSFEIQGPTPDIQ